MSSKSLKLDGAILSVLGQAEQNKALLLFRDSQEYAKFSSTSTVQAGGDGLFSLMPSSSLLFVAKDEAPMDLVEMMRRRGLKSPAPGVAPLLLFYEAGVPKRATTMDVVRIMVVGRALVDLVANRDDVASVWRGRAGARRDRSGALSGHGCRGGDAGSRVGHLNGSAGGNIGHKSPPTVSPKKSPLPITIGVANRDCQNARQPACMVNTIRSGIRMGLTVLQDADV